MFDEQFSYSQYCGSSGNIWNGHGIRIVKALQDPCLSGLPEMLTPLKCPRELTHGHRPYTHSLYHLRYIPLLKEPPTRQYFTILYHTLLYCLMLWYVILDCIVLCYKIQCFLQTI